jgi:hypothetical protein
MTRLSVARLREGHRQRLDLCFMWAPTSDVSVGAAVAGWSGTATVKIGKFSYP